jgi:hypothetical protein
VQNLPLVVSAPLDPTKGTCLVLGVPPVTDRSRKNLLGKAFEQVWKTITSDFLSLYDFRGVSNSNKLVCHITRCRWNGNKIESPQKPRTYPCVSCSFLLCSFCYLNSKSTTSKQSWLELLDVSFVCYKNVKSFFSPLAKLTLGISSTTLTHPSLNSRQRTGLTRKFTYDIAHISWSV